MTPSQTLRKARELISEPAAWTKGQYATDASGRHQDLMSPAAVRFCSIGAIQRVCGASRGSVSAFDARQALRKALHQRGISDFNDAEDTTHEAVIAAFSRAIALAEQQEAK